MCWFNLGSIALRGLQYVLRWITEFWSLQQVHVASANVAEIAELLANLTSRGKVAGALSQWMVEDVAKVLHDIAAFGSGQEEVRPISSSQTRQLIRPWTKVSSSQNLMKECDSGDWRRVEHPLPETFSNRLFSEPHSLKENVTHGVTANHTLTMGRAHTTRNFRQPALFRATLLSQKKM